MEGGSRLRTPMGGVFDDLKMQKPPSLTPGTEASKTPWYHPDSVRTSPSWSDTLHSPVTRAKRNPLLGFRGFRLGGEFSKTQIGSHHPPILFRMLGLISVHILVLRSRCLLLLVVAATTSVQRPTALVSTGVAYPPISRAQRTCVRPAQGGHNRRTSQIA